MLEKSQNPADFKIQVMNLSTLNWMQKHLYAYSSGYFTNQTLKDLTVSNETRSTKLLWSTMLFQLLPNQIWIHKKSNEIYPSVYLVCSHIRTVDIYIHSWQYYIYPIKMKGHMSLLIKQCLFKTNDAHWF